MIMSDRIKSPKTGRWIVVGGETYNKLLKSSVYSKKIKKVKSPKSKIRRRKTTYVTSSSQCGCSK